MEKLELSYITGKKFKMLQQLQKTVWRFFKMLKIKSYDQEITFLVIYAEDSKKIYTHTHKNLFMNGRYTIIFNSPKQTNENNTKGHQLINLKNCGIFIQSIFIHQKK